MKKIVLTIFFIFCSFSLFAEWFYPDSVGRIELTRSDGSITIHFFDTYEQAIFQFEDQVFSLDMFGFKAEKNNNDFMELLNYARASSDSYTEFGKITNNGLIFNLVPIILGSMKFASN